MLKGDTGGVPITSTVDGAVLDDDDSVLNLKVRARR